MAHITGVERLSSNSKELGDLPDRLIYTFFSNLISISAILESLDSSILTIAAQPAAVQPWSFHRVSIRDNDSAVHELNFSDH